MSLAIYKYPIQHKDGLVRATMPQGAKILHVAEQRGVITLWAMVDPEQKKFDTRLFLVLGTGQPIDNSDQRNLTHLGTILSGMFVWHVFEWRA